MAAKSQPDERPPIAGGWATRSPAIAGTTFEMMLPAQPDELLNIEEVRAPYWSYLWPAAYDFAAWILRHGGPPRGDVLEIGCGIGLAGLAGLAAGWRVTFSDYEPTAVRLAVENARRNGFENQRGVVWDWHEPAQGAQERFATIIGCDVLYDVANHGAILDLLDAALIEKGCCLLADPDRASADEFVVSARQRGYAVEQERLPTAPFPGRPNVRSRLFWIGDPHLFLEARIS